jgi:hypothetical protein
VTAGDGIFATESPVGSFTTGPGVGAFEVTLDSVADPPFRLGAGLSPYVHLADGGFAPPLLEIAGGSAPDVCLDLVIDFGGVDYCPTDATVDDVACPTAVVTYALAGMTATEVLIRAFPVEAGEIDDDPTLTGILEATGPGDAGEVDVGCLASGLTYTITLDAVGDADGILAFRELDVP